MRETASLKAHRKSCSGVPRRICLFDLMVIKAENPCLHSQVDRKINSWETATRARFGYDDAMLNQQLIGQHSLCFVFAVSSVRMSISSSCSPVPTGTSINEEWVNQ